MSRSRAVMLCQRNVKCPTRLPLQRQGHAMALFSLSRPMNGTSKTARKTHLWQREMEEPVDRVQKTVQKPKDPPENEWIIVTPVTSNFTGHLVVCLFAVRHDNWTITYFHYHNSKHFEQLCPNLFSERAGFYHNCLYFSHGNVAQYKPLKQARTITLLCLSFICGE